MTQSKTSPKALENLSRKTIADKSANSSPRNTNRSLAHQKLVDFLKKTSRVWHQYTDHVIRNEKDYWQHFNYVHQNCVKHGYTKNMWRYGFSSIHQYDKELITDCFRRYPIKDFQPEMRDIG